MCGGYSESHHPNDLSLKDVIDNVLKCRSICIEFLLPLMDAKESLPVNHDDFISRYRLTNFGREQVILEI